MDPWGFLKKKKSRKWYALIVIVLILFLLYKSDFVMIDMPERVFSVIERGSGVDLNVAWTKFTGNIFKFEENINPLRFKKDLYHGNLPVYNLELSSNDLKHIDNVSKTAIDRGYLGGDINTWRASKLIIDDKEYPIEIRLHGSHYPHWDSDLKSYQIKTNSEEYIDGLGRFNLVTFEQKIDTKIVGRISDMFGLPSVKDDVIALRINGVPQGMYYMQQKYNTDYLEENLCSNCYVFSIKDTRTKDHAYNFRPHHSSSQSGVMWGTGHVTPFVYELSSVSLDETIPGTNPIVHYKINDLFEKLEAKDNNIMELFDIDYLASHEAFRAIIGNSHMIAGDNTQMFYRGTNGKFYPIPTRENIGELKLKGGGFENSLNTFFTIIDLTYMWYQNDEFRHLRNKKLYDFIQNQDPVSEYEAYVDEIRPYALSYNTNYYNSRHLKRMFDKQGNMLRNNIALIKENLEYSKAYINIVSEKGKILVELIPDSISGIAFNDLRFLLEDSYEGTLILEVRLDNSTLRKKELFVNNSNDLNLAEYLEGLYFSAGLDEELVPEKRIYSMEFSFKDNPNPGIKDVLFTIRNDVSGTILPKEDIYYEIADGSRHYSVPASEEVDLFMAENSEIDFKFIQEEQTLILKQGTYNIDNNFVLPKVEKLVVEPGTRLRLDYNVSMLVSSASDVVGTAQAPIVIEAQDPNMPFGTVAFVGSGDSKMNFEHLDFSGGSEQWINGMYFSGQFGVYHADVTLKNSHIHGGNADDGINIKYGKVLIDNTEFTDNLADQIDLDFVEGIVMNSRFYGIKGEGGDNLDLSGSRVIIKDSVFSGSSDKGVSIGEQTNVTLFKNVFEDNFIGVAVKDLSRAYFVNNVFSENDFAIDAYQKKQIFGGSTSYVYNGNQFIANGEKFRTDDFSTIQEILSNEASYTEILAGLKDEELVFPEVGS